MSVTERLASVVARVTQGDARAAQGLHDELSAAAAALGKDHPDVLEGTRVLAGLHRRAGDLSGARTLLEEAFAAGQYSRGDAHPAMLGLSHDLALLAAELENRHEARRNFERIRRLGPAALGPDHEYVRAAERYLGGGAGPPAAAARSGPAWVTPPAIRPPAIHEPDDPAETPRVAAPTAGPEPGGAVRVDQPEPSVAPGDPAGDTPASSADEEPSSDPPDVSAAGPMQPVWPLPPDAPGRPASVSGPPASAARSVTSSTPDHAVWAPPAADQATYETRPLPPQAPGQDAAPTRAPQAPPPAAPAGQPQAPAQVPARVPQAPVSPPPVARPSPPPQARPSPPPQAPPPPPPHAPAPPPHAPAPPPVAPARPPTDPPQPHMPGGPPPAPLYVPPTHPAPGPYPPPTAPTAARPALPLWPAGQQPRADAPARPVPAHRYAAGREPDLPPQPARRGSRLVFIVVGVLATIALTVSATVLVLAFLRADPPDRPGPPAASASPTRPPIQLGLRDNGAAVILTWTDPSNGGVTFVVAYGRADGPADHTLRIPAGTTSITINGLNPRTDYCFTVAGIDSTTTIALSHSVCTSRGLSTGPTSSR